MARVFTCQLNQPCMVLCRTGSINPHTSGSVRAAMGVTWAMPCS
ncbi:MAG: hypothetical protein RBT74_06620 [Tenuifilaceae bacterium]|nr:hypothetical protein [Tenuifilaceae bacterium]